MTGGADIALRIQQELGAAIPTGGEDALRAVGISGQAPNAVAFPKTEEHVAQLLALANQHNWSVVPWGSGSTRPGARPAARYDLAVVLTGLGAVLDHDSDNLTLTAQSGIPLAEANRQLRPKHQFLPFGFPFDRRTLGGIVAANRTPPQRLQYGDLRDQLLGMRVAMVDGSLVRYGRKVLKNVAGYDMNKLFLGSEGQFGIIVELTMKLAAMPDTTAFAVASFSGAAEAFACAAGLFRSALQPSGIFLLDPASGAAFRKALALPEKPGVTLVTGFEGRGVTVKRQLTDCAAAMRTHNATDVVDISALNEAAAAILEHPGGVAAPTVLRCGVAPSELARLWASLDGALGIPGSAAKVADYGVGRLVAGVPNPADPAPLAARIAALGQSLAAARGYVTIERGTPQLHALAGGGSQSSNEAALLHALKSKLDPQGILAPGRTAL